MNILPRKFLTVIILPIVYFISVFAFVLILSFNVLNGSSRSTNTEEKMVKAPVYTLFSKVPPVLGAYTSSLEKSDARPVIVEQFFAKFHSPLTPYSEKFVEAADKYNLPWELLPAISMQESNGGKKLPREDCFNPFGWGVHSQGTLCFSKFEEAIDKVAAGLKKNYVDQGLVTTTQIMSKYNPISFKRDGSWGNGVEYFIEEIQNFITPPR